MKRILTLAFFLLVTNLYAQTPTNTVTVTPTFSFTPTKTATPTFTNTFTSTNTPTNTLTFTMVLTQSFTPTNSFTQVPATNSFTPTVSFTPTNTFVFTNSFTPTPSYTPTNSYTSTPSFTYTPSFTNTVPTNTPIATETNSSTITPTFTPTPPANDNSRSQSVTLYMRPTAGWTVVVTPPPFVPRSVFIQAFNTSGYGLSSVVINLDSINVMGNFTNSGSILAPVTVTANVSGLGYFNTATNTILPYICGDINMPSNYTIVLQMPTALVTATPSITPSPAPVAVTIDWRR